MCAGSLRSTRLTNAFGKTIKNHLHMLTLYVRHYNFVRTQRFLKATPAMAGGVDDTLRDMVWIVGTIDAWAPKPKRPGPKPGTKYQP